MRTFLLALLAFALPVFAAPPPQAFDLDASATNRRFTLTTAQGTTPLFRANLRNANAAFSATGWTGTLYLSDTFDATSVIAIPSTATGATYLDFQLDATDTATNGVFVANIIATDGTSTIEWQRGEVTINPSPGTAGAGTVVLSTPLSWSGYQYSGTGASGPYRAGSNVVFTTNGDGSVDINADVSAGAGDLTAITSTDSSITVTSGTGPVPNVALPSTLPARNGSLLTALNASALASGTVPAARLGSGTASIASYLRGDSTFGNFEAAVTNAVAGKTIAPIVILPESLQLELSSPEGTGILMTPDADSGIGVVEVSGSMTISGDLDAATINATGTISGSSFAGDGSSITNLNASALTSGTVPDARLASKYRQPVIAWSYRDLAWNTTAGAGWTGYEIESGSSPTKRTFGLDAISAAASTDQTGTFKTDWVAVPATFAAFKTTGAIKITWVSSQAVVGESELRGIRLIGSSDLTGANATDLYTDTTTRDITTSGVPVAVSINRSSFASTTVPAYICAQIDASVEDGDKLAIISIEVLSE